MKALILAAGLGTRLRPFTDLTPKPLFTLNGRPLLGTAIEKLQRAGFEAVLVNTHHLYEQVEHYLSASDFPIPVIACREVDILGTGGAIRNVAGLWDADPLLVINADIVTDIDIAEVYRYHRSHGHPVTMVMHESPAFNSVAVSEDGFVVRFGCGQAPSLPHRVLAFTGIHVLDRRVLDFLPPEGPAHIIDAYRRMLDVGEKIKARVVNGHYWQDIGTPDRYREAVFDHMAPRAFETAFGRRPDSPIQCRQLHGDGSDRLWYRLQAGPHCLIMADHGIRCGRGQQEVDAFTCIGRHLNDRGVAVPRIYLSDNFAGLVFLEDLGDSHLQTLVHQSDPPRWRPFYQQVIDQWITMAMEGGRNFDPSWTYQTDRYDRSIILERECRYFLEAFVQRYLGWHLAYDDLASEFQRLADRICADEISGFLHRDFQSRNIMVQNGRICVIDFQGGRLGPIQYDLASLLIDPYTDLPIPFQEQLKDHGIRLLEARYGIDPDKFAAGYRTCAVSRNLQILGAFAFLSLAKGKTQFRQYIPGAARSLVHNLSRSPVELPKTTALAQRIAAALRA